MEKYLRLYNTASKKLEKVNLTKLIGIYVCGITPYDTTHLGHAFTYLSFDLLNRYLRFLGSKITYIQNVTDIDDDILLRAKSENRNWKELGETETKKFLKDMEQLNWKKPDYFVKATDHISEMIQINQKLLEKGYAYEKSGGVYFEVAKDPAFAKRLCHLSPAATLEIANERGNFPNDPSKKDPLDFVLWQKAKKGEPSWNSPWGKGRPGWHIECSAMSTKYLGQPFMIHGGGADLRFPHHEAEISQSEKAAGKKLADIWMHTAMVYCNHKKMSKSLGNMVFVKDMLKICESNAIRLYLLSHHYRKEWNYEKTDLEKYKKISERFQQNLAKVPIPTKNATEKIGKEVLEALNNDLDSPSAIKKLEQLSHGTNEEKQTAKLLAQKIFGLKF